MLRLGGERRHGGSGHVRVQTEVLVTGVRGAGHLAVAPHPGPGVEGAAGVAGAPGAAPQGGADDVWHGAPRGLPEDQSGAVRPGGGAVLGYQRLGQQAGATEGPQVLVETDSQLGDLRPAGQFPAPLGRQREVITAGSYIIRYRLQCTAITTEDQIIV